MIFKGYFLSCNFSYELFSIYVAGFEFWAFLCMKVYIFTFETKLCNFRNLITEKYFATLLENFLSYE